MEMSSRARPASSSPVGGSVDDEHLAAIFGPDPVGLVAVVGDRRAGASGEGELAAVGEVDEEFAVDDVDDVSHSQK